MAIDKNRRVLTKRDFLKKGGKASLSLGVGITLLRRKPRLRAVTYFGVQARALDRGCPSSAVAVATATEDGNARKVLLEAH
jgi:hypothetical protein